MFEELFVTGVVLASITAVICVHCIRGSLDKLDEFYHCNIGKASSRCKGCVFCCSDDKSCIGYKACYGPNQDYD